MKIQILQDNLKNGLFVVSHTAGKNVNLPILHNILIEAKAGKIKLSSTNLEIGVTCEVRGKIDLDGSFTVDAKTFYDYITTLPNKKIDIELVGEQLVVLTDQQQTKINGQSVDDFPLIPVIDKNNGFRIDLKKIKEALASVIFSVATSDNRVELTGVLFVIEDNQLTLVATDSYRLAESKKDIQGMNSANTRIIIPVRAVQEVLRIIGGLKNSIQEVEVYFTENQVLFVYDSIEIISRIIDGQYPDYKQIIPTTIKTEARLDTQELIKLLKAASIFSKTGVNDVNIDLPAGKNEVVVSAVSGQLGENISKISAQVKGDDNGVVVNCRYLLDGLNNIETENVKIQIVDGNTPVIIKPDGLDGYLYLVMPIKQ